jgi:hypothetical protein
MVAKRLFVFSIISLLLISCTKHEVRQLDFKGDLILKLTTYSEFGKVIKDNANIDITLEGTSPLLKSATDISGQSKFDGLSMGNYNLIISKNGYGTIKIQNFNFFGGEAPTIYSTYLMQKSTTIIKNFVFSISKTQMTLTGNISHKYNIPSPSSYPNGWPLLVAYFSDSPEVSWSNYKMYCTFNSLKDKDTTFNYSTNYSTSLFPTGRTVYSIIYGTQSYNQTYFDYETNTYYNPCLGLPSEKKSVVIP